MTTREAAVITAFTGVLVGDLITFLKYAEELLGRPVFTHDLSNEEVLDELKELSREDLLKIHEGLTISNM
ncbi:hypothetical protein OAF54_03550 [bacterium]|nr:hypothetical protein [bacterium]